jgi:hypothetical protein
VSVVREQFERITRLDRVQPISSQLRPPRPEAEIRRALFAALGYVPESVAEWFLCHDGLPHEVYSTVAGTGGLFGRHFVHSLEDSLRPQLSSHSFEPDGRGVRHVYLLRNGYVDVDLGGAFLSDGLVAPSLEEYLMLWADYLEGFDDPYGPRDSQVLAHFGAGSGGVGVGVEWKDLTEKWLYENEPTNTKQEFFHASVLEPCVQEFRRMRPLQIAEPRYTAPPLGDHQVQRPIPGIPDLMHTYPDRPDTWGPDYGLPPVEIPDTGETVQFALNEPDWSIERLLRTPAKQPLYELEIRFEILQTNGEKTIVMRAGSPEHRALDPHTLVHLGAGVFSFAGPFSFRWAPSPGAARSAHSCGAEPLPPASFTPIWEPLEELFGSHFDPESVKQHYQPWLNPVTALTHSGDKIFLVTRDFRIAWSADTTAESQTIYKKANDSTPLPLHDAWFGNTGPNFPKQLAE